MEGGLVVCTRCKKKAPPTEVCPICGSSRLSGSRPGRERLERDLRATISSPEIRIVSIGEWNATDVTPSSSLIVCTDLALLSGGCEDLRKKERLMIAFRRLADRAISSSSTLCIQANYALLNEAKTWLTADGLREAYAKEFTERTAFRLPPAYRLAKIIFRGNEPAIRIIFERLLNEASLIGGITVQGLYPVEHRGAREERWIAHVAAPAETPDAAFFGALAPAVASDALIDLDPVAFFE
jgi:primosomal protein N'